MLSSLGLSDGCERAASLRARVVAPLTLNPGWGTAGVARLAVGRLTTADAIGGDARRRQRHSRDAADRTSADAVGIGQDAEKYGERALSAFRVATVAGLAEAPGAMDRTAADQNVAEPDVVNAAVNQMDQVTPQNANPLIPTSRYGQSERAAGNRSGRKGRG